MVLWIQFCLCHASDSRPSVLYITTAALLHDCNGCTNPGANRHATEALHFSSQERRASQKCSHETPVFFFCCYVFVQPLNPIISFSVQMAFVYCLFNSLSRTSNLIISGSGKNASHVMYLSQCNDFQLFTISQLFDMAVSQIH